VFHRGLSVYGTSTLIVTSKFLGRTELFILSSKPTVQIGIFQAPIPLQLNSSKVPNRCFQSSTGKRELHKKGDLMWHLK
jgi:hypothetical protein